MPEVSSPGILIAAVVSSAVGANKWHLGLMNAAGARYYLEVVCVQVVPGNTAAVTGLAPTFQLKRMSNLNTGGAVVFRKLDKTNLDVPSGVTALSNLTTPTAESAPELASVVVSTEETQAGNGNSTLWPPLGLELLNVRETVRLNHGDGIAVQQSALAGAGSVDVYIYFRVRRK